MKETLLFILFLTIITFQTSLAGLLSQPAQPSYNTVPAFSVQTAADTCRLDLSDELFGGVAAACGRNLDRSRCCPVLAAWLFAAHARSALQVNGTAPEYSELPMMPDDSQKCVNTLQSSLQSRNIHLAQPNASCDAVLCFCGIRLHQITSLSCSGAFNVSGGYRNATPTAAVRNLERNCKNSTYGGCTKCLGALQKMPRRARTSPPPPPSRQRSGTYSTGTSSGSRRRTSSSGPSDTPPQTHAPASSTDSTDSDGVPTQRSSRASAHRFESYPDDGCPFTQITRGAKWNGQPVLFPNGPRTFYPKASKQMRLIYQGKMLLPGNGGEKWSKIPLQMKWYYFEELRKHFWLPSALLRPLWDTFDTASSDVYRKMLNKVKSSGKKPDWMGAEQWAAWTAYWIRKDVKLVSDQNKENRNKVPSDGSGVSIHHRGSRSAATSHIESVFDNAPKRLYTEFKETKYGEGGWTCRRSEDIAAEMERRLDGRELPREEEDAIFLEVNPMDDKGRVYGLGSLGPIVAAPRPGPSQGPPMYTAAQVQELMAQTVAPLHQQLTQRDEEIQTLQQQQEAMNQQMARFAAFMERYPPPPPQ